MKQIPHEKALNNQKAKVQILAKLWSQNCDSDWGPLFGTLNLERLFSCYF